MNDVVEETPAQDERATSARSRESASDAVSPDSDGRTQDSSLVRRWVRLALFALLPVALLVGAYEYVTGGRTMSTEDAYVEADKVGISTDISGIVARVDVRENQIVKTGDVLFSLSDLPYQISLRRA